jgi:hypothetical protein
MIDEIPIIGVTEWTVDGLAAKEFTCNVVASRSRSPRLGAKRFR